MNVIAIQIVERLLSEQHGAFVINSDGAPLHALEKAVNLAKQLGFVLKHDTKKDSLSPYGYRNLFFDGGSPEALATLATEVKKISKKLTARTTEEQQKAIAYRPVAARELDRTEWSDYLSAIQGAGSDLEQSYGENGIDRDSESFAHLASSLDSGVSAGDALEAAETLLSYRPAQLKTLRGVDNDAVDSVLAAARSLVKMLKPQ
jgi:hypothetical protein